MKFEHLSDIFGKAWTHFDSLAKQRLTSHNFYFILVAASLATFMKMVTDLRDDDDWERLWHLFAGFNIGIPIIFLGLDTRFKHLMESLKLSLEWVESHHEWPSGYCTFSADKKKGLRRHFSMTNGMRVVFVSHCAIGIWLYASPISPRNTPVTPNIPAQQQPTQHQSPKTSSNPSQAPLTIPK